MPGPCGLTSSPPSLGTLKAARGMAVFSLSMVPLRLYWGVDHIPIPMTLMSVLPDYSLLICTPTGLSTGLVVSVRSLFSE